MSPAYLRGSDGGFPADMHILTRFGCAGIQRCANFERHGSHGPPGSRHQTAYGCLLLISYIYLYVAQSGVKVGAHDRRVRAPRLPTVRHRGAPSEQRFANPDVCAPAPPPAGAHILRGPRSACGSEDRTRSPRYLCAVQSFLAIQTVRIGSPHSIRTSGRCVPWRLLVRTTRLPPAPLGLSGVRVPVDSSPPRKQIADLPGYSPGRDTSPSVRYITTAPIRPYRKPRPEFGASWVDWGHSEDWSARCYLP